MKKRSYNPVKLADSLQYFNDSLLNKFGKTDYVIYSKWPEIVGTFFVQHSNPEKITTVPQPIQKGESEHQTKILHVSVAPSAAIEFQHFQNKIIEKINSFLGYKAIHRIKIYQNFVSKVSYLSPKKYNKFQNNIFNQIKNEIKDTTKKINDKELGKSLSNLGLSIVKNEKN